MAASSLKKTKGMLAFQLKLLSETSADALKSHTDDILKMYQDKKKDMQKLQEHMCIVQKEFSDAEKRMDDLMVLFQEIDVPKQEGVMLSLLKKLLPSRENSTSFHSVSQKCRA